MHRIVTLALSGLLFWAGSNCASSENQAATQKRGDAKAREILQRAIRAAGGEQALARLKAPMTWKERGTFYGMGGKLAFVGLYSAKYPNWYRQEIENAFTITVKGKKAWVKSANGVQKLSGDMLKEQGRQVRVSWAGRLFPLKGKAYMLHDIAGIEVDGRPTVAFKASHADGRDVKFYFDAKTYLLAKIETQVISPQHGLKPVASEAFYSNHRSFGAVKVPTKLRLLYDKKLFVEAETVDYKLDAKLDSKQFAEPK